MKGHGGQKHLDVALGNLVSAKMVYAAGQHRQAYDLAGRAVEEAMIAIRLKSNNQMQVPGNEQGGKWHDLDFLADRSGVRNAMVNDAKGNKRLAANWLIVRDWKSNGRFADIAVSQRDALDLLNAVGHDEDGILRWMLNRYETI